MRAPREERRHAPHEHAERHQARAPLGPAIGERPEDRARREVPHEKRRRERPSLKVVQIERVLRLDAREHRREHRPVDVVEEIEPREDEENDPGPPNHPLHGIALPPVERRMNREIGEIREEKRKE